MSQRRTSSKRRRRSKKRGAVSSILGNLMIELIGFAALLFILFFVHSTPIDHPPSQVTLDRQTATWQVGNDVRAYVSELFGMQVQLPN